MENAYYLEMPVDYRELAEAYYHQFAPEGPIEQSLVDTMVYDTWLRNRALEFLGAYSYDPDQHSLNDMLDTARRRVPVLERRYAKALSSLKKVQKHRIGVSATPKLASFRHIAPRRSQAPVSPKTASGEWVN
ncbi:MAG: hypothetical protein ABI806_24505 [Candidatus Solibacter sp.]